MDAATRLQTLGPYQMGERLGVGGMAEVFAAESKQFGRVALKRILPGLAEDSDFADMFWDEARMTSRLDHPNVVKILDYGRINAQLYMALEYVGGPNLAKVLRKAARMKLVVEESTIVGVVTDLLNALHYVHTATSDRGVPLGIVHRDVSPGNVMLSTDGQLKLGDFGILRSNVVVRRTQPGELKGKMGYMSPEQALGAAVTAQSDIFSVGIILAEFLTLRPLFLGKNEMHTLSRTASVDLSTWKRHNGSVAPELRAIVEKALKSDASLRFESAAEMSEVLRKYGERAGLDLGLKPRQELLSKLELLRGDQQISGARRIRRTRMPNTAPSSVSGEALGEASPEPVTVVELPTLRQVPRAVSSSQGRASWTSRFTQKSLLMKMILAFRQARDGVVELSVPGTERRLTVELRDGAISAVHHSEGLFPLGRLLMDASLLTSKQLAEVIGQSRRFKLRLGQYLVMHGRLRESVLLRLLAEQAEHRIAQWITEERGTIAVYVQRGGERGADADSEPASVTALVSILRRRLPREALPEYLADALDAVVLPAHGVSQPPQGMTEPELRALRTTMKGGAYEGRSLANIISGVEEERIARREEAMFALFVGLSSGTILASGFGHDGML